MSIKKEKYNEINQTTKTMICNRGGILLFDQIYDDNRPAWNKIQAGLEGWLMYNHDITSATAKRHVDKASRELRHPHNKIPDNWGGRRK